MSLTGPKRNTSVKSSSLFMTLFAGILLAILAIAPPSPKDAEISADKFSSGRAMQDVKIIAAKPHPTGSEENAKVREYLITRLTDLGLEVSVSESELDERSLKVLNRWNGGTKETQTIYNIIGVLPGQDRSKPALLLMAHHDTVWGSPGAADDTVGIASILEIIRASKRKGNLQRDLIILFTDAEELGQNGAKHFFNHHPLRDKVGAVINFEARGGGGTSNMFQTSAENGAAVRLYARKVKQPNTTSLMTYVYSILPNETDLTPALENDYTAYNIANIGRAEYYHSPKSDAAALDEKTLQHMGGQGLDLTHALLSATELPGKKPDATFFDVFGIFTIIYAPFWGWFFLILGGVCYALSVNSKTEKKDIAKGAGRMFAFLLLGGALLYGLNFLSGAGGGADYYDRLAAIRKLESVSLLACLAMLIALFGNRTISANGRFGAVIPIFILGIIGQALAPTATYFISLPILLCGMSSLLIQRRPETLVSNVASIILGALVFGYMLSLGHLLMLGVGPDMLPVVILPAAIGSLAILPHYPGVPKRAANFGVVAGLTVSALIAIWIRLDPIAGTVPLYKVNYRLQCGRYQCLTLGVLGLSRNVTTSPKETLARGLVWAIIRHSVYEVIAAEI